MRPRRARGSTATRSLRSIATARSSSTTRATAWPCRSRTRSIFGSVTARCCAIGSRRCCRIGTRACPATATCSACTRSVSRRTATTRAPRRPPGSRCAFEPDNASAIHVIAHVMEMQGRATEGIAVARSDARHLGEQRRVRDAPRVAPRTLPHRLDATPAAITIYVDALAPNAAAATHALIDATALLWRLELRGVNVRGLLARARAPLGAHARWPASAPSRWSTPHSRSRPPASSTSRSRRGAAAPRPGYARGQHGPRPRAGGAADRRAAGLRPRRLRGRGRAHDDRARNSLTGAAAASRSAISSI